MKKFLVIFVAAIIAFASCAKDNPVKTLYTNSTSVDGVAYETTITNVGDDYYWTNYNRADEVSVKYTFYYERRSDLQKDFAGFVEGLNAIDETPLFPFFGQVLRFTDDKVSHEAIITREVNGGDVFVKFAVGEKVFRLPYAFVTEANAVVNPEQ